MRGLKWGVAVLLLAASSVHAAERQRLSLDENWRFTLNDPADTGKTFEYPEVRDLAKAHPDDNARDAALAADRKDAAAVNLGADVSFVHGDFDDSGWRQVDLPHDWAVELPFDRKGSENHGFKAMGQGLGNTIGWYRRKFDLPTSEKGQALWVEFDGVFRDSLVWLNGHCLGRNVSGYSSFWYDLSKYANYGGSNELVVRVDATRTEGWFYEGAGIYRHVWLMKTDPVHVAHWGTYVYSDVFGENATITARATVRNDSDQPRACDVTETILDADGKIVAEEIRRAVKLDASTEHEVSLRLPIYRANLWSIEKPYLYKLVTTVRDDSGVLDQYETPFGVRTLRFDADLGFFLNGKHVEIQGTCDHQDHAGVGSAIPDRLNYFRIEKLKEMGANALRTSHNDPTPEVLDACDRLGMLVMDEHRLMGTTPEITSQLTRLIQRDRNHPSVFIWSIGNEEGSIQASPYGANVAMAMEDTVHRLDPTRPCTEAMNAGWQRGLSTVIDVMGFNYLKQGSVRRGPATRKIEDYVAMDQYHAAFPQRPTIGTEEASTLSTRGIYANDPVHGYMSAYDVNNPYWGSLAEDWWPYYLNRPWVAGAFVWTGFDYRGEPTPYHWPCISSQFGIIDTCGFPKDNFYYYQAWWTNKPVLHLLPHWNWPGKEGQSIDVWCQTNFDAVELFLNGVSQGKQTTVPNHHLQWKVIYAPGTLEARGYKGDTVAATEKVETTGAPAKLIVTPDRSAINADGRDLSMVAVSVVDAQGRLVPTAGNLVKFTLSGDAKIIGVGNGDPSSHEADKAEQRSAFGGLCMAIVQAGKQGGPIQLTATADGLEPANVTINALAATQPAAAP